MYNIIIKVLVQASMSFVLHFLCISVGGKYEKSSFIDRDSWCW